MHVCTRLLTCHRGKLYESLPHTGQDYLCVMPSILSLLYNVIIMSLATEISLMWEWVVWPKALIWSQASHRPHPPAIPYTLIGCKKSAHARKLSGSLDYIRECETRTHLPLLAHCD